MSNSPKNMSAAIVRNLECNTGKTLEQWLRVTKKGPKDGWKLVKWLKEEYDLGQNTGYAIVAHSDFAPDWMTKSDEALLDDQYSKGKEGLRPIYEKVAGAVSQLGEDVVLSPRKTYVSAIRSKQFAYVQPTTKSRLDVFIRLPKTNASKRLALSGVSGSVTHKVGLASLKDVDAQLIGWLKKAYEVRGA